MSLRTDFQKHYQEIIAEYNREKDQALYYLPARHEVLHRGPRNAINPSQVGEVHPFRQIFLDLPFLAVQLGAGRPLGTPQELSLSSGTPQPYLDPLGNEITFNFRHKRKHRYDHLGFHVPLSVQDQALFNGDASMPSLTRPSTRMAI